MILAALTASDYAWIAFWCAVICVCVGVGVATEPRDEVFGCTCCGRTWATRDGFYEHRCECEATR